MTSPGPGGPDGFLLIDKPQGITSHDAVAAVRRALGTKKVGHAGTLDPMATGLLVMGVGRATRLLRFLGDQAKTYEGTFRLGVATTTLDADGDVIRTVPVEADDDRVRAAMAGQTGDLLQRPPAYSAVKVGGKKLYEAARAGEELRGRRPAGPCGDLRDDGAQRRRRRLPRGLRRRHVRPRPGGGRGRPARMRRPPHEAPAHRDRWVPRRGREAARGTRPAAVVGAGGGPPPAMGRRGRGGDRGLPRQDPCALGPRRSVLGRRARRSHLGIYEDAGTKAMPLVVLAPAGSNDPGTD